MLARRLGDPTDELRRRWMNGRMPNGPDDLVIDRSDLEDVSFMVVGDPGEGDDSQNVTIRPLLACSEGTAFMVICSDVIYPAGGASEYEQKFYEPYKDYLAPIYALPGNHDWYDGLTGFMLHFCGAEPPLTGETPPPAAGRAHRLLNRLLWRRPPRADPGTLARGREIRGRPEQHPLPEHRQPGPYWAMDVGPLRIVAIDTGITGSVDRDQLAWLRAVSESSDRPKVLLTGRPLYVDGRGPNRNGHLAAVDAVVRAREHRYVAAIGGDVHNYQRYPVEVEPGRTIEYVVSGAGGAYMSATHGISRVDLEGVTEQDFRCYPLRGDSLSAYSKVYDRRLAGGRGVFFIPADEAAAIVSEQLRRETPASNERPELEPWRSSARAVSPTERSRRAARLIGWLPGQRGYNPWLAELLDWNDPPLFKSFLRLDASNTELRIRCFAATGCGEHEQDPPLEDQVIVQLPTSI